MCFDFGYIKVLTLPPPPESKSENRKLWGVIQELEFGVRKHKCHAPASDSLCSHARMSQFIILAKCRVGPVLRKRRSAEELNRGWGWGGGVIIVLNIYTTLAFLTVITLNT